MQVLIVEDEILLARQLRKLLLDLEPLAAVLAITQSVEETVAWLNTHPAPDLILTDIELADGKSFDIFQQTEVAVPVIFTTAYDEYAVKAFKLNSIDYLLKPIKEEDLHAALEKFKRSDKQLANNRMLSELVKALQPEQPVEYRNRFLVGHGSRLISIDTADIAYIFSENGYSFLRTVQNVKYIIEYKLDELESVLSPKDFFRANRQYILHHKSVTAVHPWFNQKLKVELHPATSEPIVVSRDKAAGFKAWMGE